jgi:hypothetical protein
MKTKSKLFIGILLVVIASILGLLTFGSFVANSESGGGGYLGIAYVIGVVSIALFISGLWSIVSNVKIAKDA